MTIKYLGSKRFSGTSTGNVTGTEWDISTASYASKSGSVSEAPLPQDLSFSSDGTKMYVIGRDADKIFQYSLSTAWDVSTSSYDSVSFSTTSQEYSPTGMYFKSDGTKMWLIGYSNRTVYQYTLSTAWDLSTTSYDSVSFSATSQLSASIFRIGMYFKSDGTKLYLTDDINDKVFQYSLSTAWDVSTSSYDSVSFNISQDTLPSSIFFKSDGTKMHILGDTNNTVYQYSLSTAWDLSTASYDSVSLSVTGQETAPQGLAFKSNGSILYVVGTSNDTVYQYTITSYSSDKTDLTNVQDNSIFVETDTARRYWLSENKVSISELKAYYNFDETSGTVLTNQAGTAGSSDSLGTSVNGTNVGTATVNQTGKIDKAYDFDGAGTGASYDHIVIPNALGTDLAGTNKVSYSLWFNTDEFTNSQGNGWDLIGTYGGTTGADYQGLSINHWYDGNWYIYAEYHGSFSGNAYGGISQANLGTTATGTWYHMVVVYDGTATGNANRLKIYLNGVQKTFDSFSGTIASTISYGDHPTYIGRPSYGSTYQKNFNGKIDEVIIWKRVLTDSEISALYNSGTGSTVDNAKDPTWTRGFFNARGVFSSGYLGANINVIDYVTISTLGNATDFGDMSENRRAVAGASNDTRGLFAGGYGASSYVDTIDYITIATAGNATDFGNLTTSARYAPMGASSDTRGLFAGGETPYSNVIDYVTISTTANATDFGDLTAARKSGASTSDKTKAVFMGGEGSTTTMDYVTIATTGNATSWGSMSVGVNGAGTGTISNGTRGVVSLGAVVGNSYSNIIHYKTIATNANSVDFGDLTQGRSGAGQCGDSTRGVFGGGKYQSGGSSGVVTIDYITISTLGNATDFGDLTSARYAMAGVSDGQ